MRYVYFAILMAFLAVLLGFAVVNRQPLSVGVPLVARRVELPAYLVLFAAYVLGMLSGWSLVGFLRSSIRRASESPPRRAQ